MRWDRISVLIDAIEEDLARQRSVIYVDAEVTYLNCLQLFPFGVK